MRTKTPPLDFFQLTLEEIIPEERNEFTFPDIEGYFPIPWRTLWQRKELGKLEGLKVKSTTLKWAWITVFYEWTAKLGCETVFGTSYSDKASFKVLTYPDYVKEDIVALPKSIDFSFVGWSNNKCRKRIFELFPTKPSVIKRDDYSVDKCNPMFRTQYVDILGKSDYCLCPKGVGSGTIRFWEALKAQAIPVLISDDWPFPNCWDWSETAIRISERELMNDSTVLKKYLNLSNEKKLIFQKNCKACFEYFTNNVNLVHYIQTNI